MRTKYDIGQCVLIKAMVKQIKIDSDRSADYLVSIDTDDYMHINPLDVAINEKRIVCRWIKEGEDNE